MQERSGIITMTTDFGSEDVYVGVMKGVILGIFPDARIVDLTHQVPPQDVSAGAWALKDAIPFFPPGTVHLAVVDPGVGSERRGIAVYSGNSFFVGPDNGLFSAFYPAEGIVELNRPDLFLPQVSPTFHGRDIFAPVAARLAGGIRPPELGDEISDPVTIDLAAPVQEGDLIRGEVVRIDRFGNLITNIPGSMLPPGATVKIQVCEREIEGLSICYSSDDPGKLAALIGSSGRIEVSLPHANAASELGARAGDAVEIQID